MILYYAKGACSLADHIALHEAGLHFTRVRVDLKTHLTEAGDDYRRINPKGYVPALQFDDGSVLTENIAILTWITDQAASLSPQEPLGRYRLLEMLAFISTEIHKAFKPLFTPDAAEPAKDEARATIARRLELISRDLGGDYLLGPAASAADAYLFVMLMWAQGQKIALPAALTAYFTRMQARPAVTQALQHEGLAKAA